MLRRILVAAAAAGVLAVPVGSASARSGVTTVKVTAGSPTEFHFKLSTTSVHKGTVVFRITNKGNLPHDFKIAGKKTPLLQPGKSRTLRVVFKKAGRYKYLCTVSGHAAAGMRGTLRVR